MATHSAETDRKLERDQMVAYQLADRGIRDRTVLDAMARIPRERFVPEHVTEVAYHDRALPVECEQTISQPYMVACMSELLEVQPGHRVLEIGTGSGYQSAVLAMMGAEVYSIERHEPLSHLAAERLAELGLSRVHLRVGDGSRGWPEAAPFDGVIMTAGSPSVPPALLEQLAVGGRLVGPVGPIEEQMLIRIRRTPQGYDREDILGCRFVKLIGEGGWNQ
jgi:protein-L-isoaspartate(D-aspartate) O-methyltransferase